MYMIVYAYCPCVCVCVCACWANYSQYERFFQSRLKTSRWNSLLHGILICTLRGVHHLQAPAQWSDWIKEIERWFISPFRESTFLLSTPSHASFSFWLGLFFPFYVAFSNSLHQTFWCSAFRYSQKSGQWRTASGTLVASFALTWQTSFAPEGQLIAPGLVANHCWFAAAPATEKTRKGFRFLETPNSRCSIAAGLAKRRQENAMSTTCSWMFLTFRKRLKPLRTRLCAASRTPSACKSRPTPLKLLTLCAPRWGRYVFSK